MFFYFFGDMFLTSVDNISTLQAVPMQAVPMQAVPMQAPMQAPVQQPPKPREKRGIQIINPNTGKSIFDDEPNTTSAASAVTAAHQTPPAEPAQVDFILIEKICSFAERFHREFCQVQVRVVELLHRQFRGTNDLVATFRSTPPLRHRTSS